MKYGMLHIIKVVDGIIAVCGILQFLVFSIPLQAASPDKCVMEPKISSFRNFGGRDWAWTDDWACTVEKNSPLSFLTAVYQDECDVSFKVIMYGEKATACFVRNSNLSGSRIELGYSGDTSWLKVFSLFDGQLVQNFVLADVSFSSGREYGVFIRKRVDQLIRFYVDITDMEQGVTETLRLDEGKLAGFGGGMDFYMSDGERLMIRDFCFSLPQKAELLIVGHSFIEGDSVHGNRDRRYAALIAKALGQDSVFISGLGGGAASHFSEGTLQLEVSWLHPKYVFINLGTNDRNDEAFIAKAMKMKNALEAVGVMPIWATISPDLRNGVNTHDAANAWILQQEYYVDIRGAFNGVDGRVDEASLLPDRVHPTLETHGKIATLFLDKYGRLLRK